MIKQSHEKQISDLKIIEWQWSVLPAADPQSHPLQSQPLLRIILNIIWVCGAVSGCN